MANWLPDLINLEKIRTDVLKEVADATALEPTAGNILIQPTLFEGVKVTFKDLQLMDLPGKRLKRSWLYGNRVKSTPAELLTSEAYTAEPEPLDRAVSQRLPVLAQVGSVQVFVRYWPLVRHQEIQISKIHLDRINILGGQQGLFTHYIPIILEPDYLERHKKEDVRVKVLNAKLLLTNLQITKHPGHFKQQPALQSGDQQGYFRFASNRIEISHLMSHNPVQVRGTARWGLFDSALRQQPSSNLARQLAFDARIAAMGTDADALTDRQWSVNDIQRARLTIQRPGIFQAGEGIRLEFLPKTAEHRKQPNRSASATPYRLLQLHTGLITLQPWQNIAQEWADLLVIDTPPELTHYLISGKAKTDMMARIDAGAGVAQVRTNVPGPVEIIEKRKPKPPVLTGAVSLQDVALTYRPRHVRVFHDLSGTIQLDDKVLTLADLKLAVEKSQFTASGQVDLGLERLDTTLRAEALSVQSLVDSILYLDPLLSKVLPQWRTPELQARVNALRSGELALSGLLDAQLNLSGPLRKPDYTGWISVQNASVTSKADNLALQDIQGRVEIDDTIFLKHLTAQVASAQVRLQGEIDKSFKRYNLQLGSQHLNLEQLYHTLIAQFPDLKTQLKDLRNITGNADINIRLTNGEQIQGSITVDQLALYYADLAKAPYPFRFPQLTINLSGNQVSAKPTQGAWGPIPLLASFNMQLPSYKTQQPHFRLDVETGQVPVSVLREHQAFFADQIGAPNVIPEIWNTAGAFSLELAVTEQATQGELAFHEAGLSWANGDLPVYGLQGVLAFNIPANGSSPQVNSRDLKLRYGNSPLNVTIRDAGQTPNGVLLLVNAEGILSQLTVNHYLTSQHATVAPYPQVPFEAAFEQQTNNTIAGRIFLNLNHLFQEAEPPVTADVTSGQSPIEPPEHIGTQAASKPVAPQAQRSLTQSPQQEAFPVKTPLERIVQPHISTDSPDHTLAIGSNLPEAYALPAISPTIEPTGDAFLAAQFAFHPNAGALELFPSRLQLADQGAVWAQGKVTDLNDLEKIAYQLRVVTSPIINVEGLAKRFRSDVFKGASGELAADIFLEKFPPGSPTPNHVDGWVELDGIELPQLLVDNITGELVLEKQQARLNFPSINIQGAELSLKGETDEVTTYPLPLENVQITGNLLNIPAIQNFNEEVIRKQIVEHVVQRFIRPWQEGDPLVPVQFKNADVNINEVIYQNIILSDLTGKLSLYANSYFQLADTKINVAGGKASGNLSMNPFDDNFVTLDLNADGVQANALTRALLNVSNQIFGEMSGSIRFTTQGMTDQQLLENANGTVTMKVTNGRLPAMTTIETLLTAANIVRGGVLGLNLNNIIRALAPFRANYFAELSGDLLIAEKKLRTNNLLSDGENLDLLIQGTVDMGTGNADLIVNGTMQQDVQGLFGSLGKISLNRLLRYVPLVGFLPGRGEIGKSPSGVIYQIPGVGYVPGLGGPAGDVNRFRVVLEGPPQDPSSIESFQWVRE